MNVIFMSLVAGVSSFLFQDPSFTCVSCNRPKYLSECTETVDCYDDETCYHFELDVDDHTEYLLGCYDKKECIAAKEGNNTFSPVFERFKHSGYCCSEDLCNRHPISMPYRLEQGVECEVCSESECDVEDVTRKICPDDFPYCMNTVHNDHNGNKYIVKQCASTDECNTLWWKETAHRDDCINYDPSSIYVKPLSCTYCCVTGHCNIRLVPDNETRFVGTR